MKRQTIQEIGFLAVWFVGLFAIIYLSSEASALIVRVLAPNASTIVTRFVTTAGMILAIYGWVLALWPLGKLFNRMRGNQPSEPNT
jgi:hypothetical protein